MTLTLETTTENTALDLAKQPIEAAIKQPIKCRKKRAPKHDFKDGCGRVFAHKHENGNGWVADTAFVTDKAYVGPRAEVFHFARVLGEAKIRGSSRLFGNATIHGRALLEQRAKVYGAANIYDNAQLFDDAAVLGSAHIAGDTQILGMSRVMDHAYVVGSCLNGSTSVRGNTSVIKSSLHGVVSVSDNAVAVNATICGNVTLRNFCQVLNSAVSLIVGRTDLLIEICDFAVVADNCQLFLPIVIAQHAVVVRTRAAFGDWLDQQAPRLGGNIVITNRTFNSYRALTTFVAQYAAQGDSMYNPPAQPAVNQTIRPPISIQPNLRRVMRVQEPVV